MHKKTALLFLVNGGLFPSVSADRMCVWQANCQSHTKILLTTCLKKNFEVKKLSGKKYITYSAASYFLFSLEKQAGAVNKW